MNRRTYWWIVAILLAVIAACALGFPSRSNSFTTKASPFTPTQGFLTNAFVESGYDFRRRFTLSWFHAPDHSIVAFQRSASNKIQLLRFHPHQPGPPAVEEPAALQHVHKQPLVHWSASPNGRWLLTVRRLGPSRLYQVYDHDFTLHRSWTYPYEGRSEPDWLNSSQGFVEWPIRESKLLARVHWIDSQASTEIDLATLALQTLRSPDTLVSPCILIRYSPTDPTVAAELLVLGPHREPKRWTRSALLLPELLRNEEKITVTISPDSNMLAWLAESTDDLPQLSLTLAPPFLQVEPQHSTSLYVSRADGRHLQLVSRTRPGASIHAVRWNPDGSSLSFVYLDALWNQPLPSLPGR